MQQHTSPAPPPADLERPELYINREASWIEFNRRVFREAQRTRHPLLERVKFISIFETNLDEFIMIRLAGIKDQVESKQQILSPDGLTPEQQLAVIREQLAPLVQEVRAYWKDTLLSLLAGRDVYILNYDQLNQQQRDAMQHYFADKIFPVLTPLAVDPGHPFPHISNLSLNLAVVIKDGIHHEPLFARVKVPTTLPRLVPVPIDVDDPSATFKQSAFVWIEQVIAAHLGQLFPSLQVVESYPFRILRDADIELQEDEAADLLQYIEQEVRDRRFGSVVDMAVNPSMPQSIRDLLLDKVEIPARDMTVIDGPLGMGDVMELYSLARPDLKDAPFTPRVPSYLSSATDLFAAIREHDLLIHHPYDSFNSVVDFIRMAAGDPDVLAIKQTLYRVGARSPVVQALLEAKENGKEVAVLVELKARFDEENNIGWAKELERAGVHVVYGLQGFKTHAKVALVIRKEQDELRRYVHLGTGNYNASTAKIYEDFGFFTCQPDFGADATELFNALTGYWSKNKYRKLLVAPDTLRSALVQRIEREIQLHEKHGNGRLIFKMNALTDPDMIQLLYRASQAGVQIDLVIRGMSCLRPQVPGVSETIRVRGFLGRFLEHSRIYYFGNKGKPEIYLGSADLMERNLNRRVESLFPIDSRTLRRLLYERVIEPILADTANSSELKSNGEYIHLQPMDGKDAFDSQSWFISHPLFNNDAKQESGVSPISAISGSS